jgi:Zn finger protein HypA/HybF involved in hydrogenase expression
MAELRVCNDCKGIFKIPKGLKDYVKNNSSKHIFCPYCSSIWNHITTERFCESKRGKIFG